MVMAEIRRRYPALCALMKYERRQLAERSGNLAGSMRYCAYVRKNFRIRKRGITRGAKSGARGFINSKTDNAAGT